MGIRKRFVNRKDPRESQADQTCVWNLKINPDALVSVDYQNLSLPASVQHLKPSIFREGNAYCVILGPDPQSGIFGCGDTLEEALNDWTITWRMKARNHRYQA